MAAMRELHVPTPDAMHHRESLFLLTLDKLQQYIALRQSLHSAMGKVLVATSKTKTKDLPTMLIWV